MGNNCHRDFPPPDTSNVCTGDPIGQGDTRNHIIPHFCTLAGAGGNDKRREYCGRIGDREWRSQGEANRCTYDDCGEVKEYKPGCCDGCCGIAGRGVFCERVAYRGNPNTCCFRDKVWRGQTGDPDDQLCFQTNNRQRTCPPENRNITGTNCQDTLLSFCSGDDLDPQDTSWLNRWSSSPEPFVNGQPNCVYAINRNLFINPEIANVLNGVQPNPRDFQNAPGFAWSRTLLENVFQKYADQGFIIGTLPGFPGYNSFQDDILQPICTSVPGICQQGLFSTCSNTTTDELIRNPSEVPWCGCYMPEAEYQKYVDEFQVNRECTPICARQGNIPIVSADGIDPLLCNQTVCIIDDVTIALEDVNVGGQINFAQFCAGCSHPVSGVNEAAGGSDPVESLPRAGQTMNRSSCLCIISNNTIAGASSQIEGINLDDFCGSNSQCFRQNPNPGNGQPDMLQIPCDSSDNFNPFAERQRRQEEEAAERQFRIVVIALIVIVGIFVLIFFIWLLSRFSHDPSPKIIPRYRPGLRPVLDKAAIHQVEQQALYADAVGGSILDRGRFPLYPRPATNCDMEGSILDRGMTPGCGKHIPSSIDESRSILYDP